jgi:hypothetical protein
MVLSGLFHLYELVQACTSLYKLKKVSCKFTDDYQNQNHGLAVTQEIELFRPSVTPAPGKQNDR